MGIIVDTNVLIDSEHGRLQWERLAPLRDQPVYLAAVSAAELLAGVHLATDADLRLRRLSFVEHILRHIPVLPFDLEVARIHAALYADALRQTGRRALNAHDLQIAATAIAHEYPLLTANRDDFRRIPGLQLIEPDAP